MRPSQITIPQVLATELCLRCVLPSCRERSPECLLNQERRKYGCLPILKRKAPYQKRGGRGGKRPGGGRKPSYTTLKERATKQNGIEKDAK